jgi:hypothetical protein
MRRTGLVNALAAGLMLALAAPAACGQSGKKGPAGKQAAPGCGGHLTGTAAFSAAGGEGTVQMGGARPGCRWDAVSDAPWLTLSSAGQQWTPGSASRPFSVAANRGWDGRRATIRAEGQTLEVTQSGCSVTVEPLGKLMPQEAGTGAVAVTTDASGCPWTASSNVPWLTITSAKSGDGSATVEFRVTANTGANRQRQGELRIGPATFVVTQLGRFAGQSGAVR